MSNITVIGGGNMGMVLASKFSQKHNVTLFLNGSYESIKDYKYDFVSINDQSKIATVAKVKRITSSLEEAIKDAEWVFVTYPAFLFSSFSKELIPLLKKGQHLVGVPGSGGFEMQFKDALLKGCTITGLQRVHCVARIEKRGELVHESGVRSGLKCASIPLSFGKEAADFLSNLYDLPVEDIGCYLNVTLVNSNPILHTSRLYSIFSDYHAGVSYASLPLFYEDWSLESSLLLEKMDSELFELIRMLNEKGYKVDKITSLLQHYESNTPEEMTRKLNSIQSLKGLTTPSVKVESNDGLRFIPDFSSRYFTADFPYGLDILISICKLFGIDCHNMKAVSDWYHDVTKTKSQFDLKKLGIKTIDDFEFYRQ